LKENERGALIIEDNLWHEYNK